MHLTGQRLPKEILLLTLGSRLRGVVSPGHMSPGGPQIDEVACSALLEDNNKRRVRILGLADLSLAKSLSGGDGELK